MICYIRIKKKSGDRLLFVRKTYVKGGYRMKSAIKIVEKKTAKIEKVLSNEDCNKLAPAAFQRLCRTSAPPLINAKKAPVSSRTLYYIHPDRCY